MDKFKVFYSAVTGGWYFGGVHADMPSDVVEVEWGDYLAIMNGCSPESRAGGGSIIADATGRPVLDMSAVPTQQEIDAGVEKQWRDQELADTDYLVMPDYGLDEKKAAEVSEYRINLRNWPQAKQFPDKEFRPVRPGWL